MRVQDDDGLSGETQDPIVDARLDCLYRDAGAMEKLDEVDAKSTRHCRKYVARKMLAWNTKYPPKNDGAAAIVEASAPPRATPTAPPWPPMSPARNVAWPSLIKRAKPTSNC